MEAPGPATTEDAGTEAAAEAPYEALDPRVVPLWRISGTLMGLAVGGGLGAGAAWSLDRLGLADLSLVLAGAAGAIALALLQGLVMPGIVYRHWGYRLGPSELRLRRGVVVETDTWIPYARLQFAEVRRGPLQRRFGLASLVLHTAGVESGTVDVPGLAEERAEELRRHLLDLIGHDHV